jgi:hypothetical protein
MQIGWFASAHDTVMPWKDALVERVHASWPWRAGRIWKERFKRLAAAQARRLQPTMLELRSLMRAAADRVRARTRRLMHRLKERWAMLRSSR